ncbi:MAG: hypothetical protein ABFD69_03180 [Candidatus Sumerlaeia bacterium]
MRTISADALARRYEPAQTVAWLLELACGEWTWRGSTLAVETDGTAWPARVAAVERWREELPSTAIPTGRVRASADVRVLDLPASDDSLRARLDVAPPLGIEATLRLMWLDDGPARLEDSAVMLRGSVVSWRIEPAGVRLELIDQLAVLEQRRIGRLLRPAMIGGDSSPMLGKPLPWVFGRHEGLELPALRPGLTARLARPVMTEETVIPLTSVAGFPSRGRLQIGSEVIRYAAIDQVAGTVGTPLSPVARGAGAEDYATGTLVRQLPPRGLHWFVADHFCLSVDSVHADGMPLDGNLWSCEVVPLGDWHAQVLAMNEWPMNAEGKPAAEITANVSGLADGGGVIENPARVIELLLTNERLGALAPERLDAAAFSSAAGTLAGRGYRFARRTAGNETLGELLEGAAREASLWLSCGDPIAPIVADPMPRAAASEEVLDARHALRASAPARVSAPELFIPPDALELVGPARAGGRGRSAYIFPPEKESSGSIPHRISLDWLALDDGSAGDLGEFLWARLAEPPFEHEQEFPAGAALLRAGETMMIDDAALRLSQALAWVWAVEAGSGGRAKLRLRGPWAGAYAWDRDLETNVRRYAFGGQLIVALGGRPVACLSREGALRLAGRLREHAAIGAGPFTEPFALSGGWLYWSVGAAGVYRPFMRIDGDGNAELAGTVRERSTLAIDPGGQSAGADAGRFWLSSDGASGAFEWRAAEAILHLKSILIESVRL